MNSHPFSPRSAPDGIDIEPDDPYTATTYEKKTMQNQDEYLERGGKTVGYDGKPGVRDAGDQADAMRSPGAR
jgi:hypothetical protein